jgi:hypothetical protein
MRAQMLEESNDVGASGKADDATAAEERWLGKAWVKAMKAAGEAEGLIPAAAVARAGAGPSTDFPAVGTTIAGFTVESNAGGQVRLSRPPLYTHGLAHVQGDVLHCEPMEGFYWTYVECPITYEFTIAQYLFAHPAMLKPGANCSNFIQRLLSPDIEPITLEGVKDSQDAKTKVPGAFMRAVMEQVATFADASLFWAEQCTIWSNLYAEWRSARDRVAKGCVSSSDCACWKEVKDACDTIATIESQSGDRDVALALTDDVTYQANLRYAATGAPATVDGASSAAQIVHGSPGAE